jgi:hypothetical protein
MGKCGLDSSGTVWDQLWTPVNLLKNPWDIQKVGNFLTNCELLASKEGSCSTEHVKWKEQEAKNLNSHEYVLTKY